MAEETGLINDADQPAETNGENGNTAEGGEDTEQIRGQIEETRQEMGETIRAIEEKLSFSNISEQVKEQVSEQIGSVIETAKETIYDATVGRAEIFMKNAGRELSKSTLLKKAQDNPLPFILIGAGIGLLAYGSSNKNKSARHSESNAKNFRYGKSSEQADKSAFETAQKKIGGAVSGITDAAGDAYQSAGDLANESYKKVGEYGTQVRHQYERQIEENPLAIGAVALAVGAAIGFSIPTTSYESELMGETRQNLVQKVQDSAGELVAKVKDVASEAGQTISDEVKKQGLAQ